MMWPKQPLKNPTPCGTCVNDKMNFGKWRPTDTGWSCGEKLLHRTCAARPTLGPPFCALGGAPNAKYVSFSNGQSLGGAFLPPIEDTGINDDDDG
jgi:hypothetical protein